MAVIGKRNILSVVRRSQRGLYLDGGEHGEILLPGKYIPAGAGPGHVLDVFIYLDSEDRLVATTETPLAEVGDFACLKVLEVHPRMGAFLDWGLPKDLLLPFREQTPPVRRGERVVVHIHVDTKTNLIANKTPLGYNAIVESNYGGLLYHDSLGNALEPGQKIEGYVRAVRPDGKIDLSLEASGYKRVASLTEQVLEALEQNGGKLAFDDESEPEAIREAFGTSKKAFKQALGNLYKHRRIEFTKPGIRLLDSHG